MKIIDFRAVDKGVLKGFFSIEFLGSPSHPPHTVKDFKLMNTNGEMWIGVPSREVIEADGKKKYFPTFLIPKEFQDKFKAEVLKLLQPFLVQNDNSQAVQSECPF